MASGNLNNLTVPLGNQGQSASSQGLLMPRLKYRFIISFLGFGTSVATTELTKQVISFDKPSIDFDMQTIDVYNSKIMYAGKPKWGTTKVVIRDDMQGNVSQLVGQQVQKQFDFAEQASASSGIDYKFQMNCQITDGGNGTSDPVILETWELFGCFLTAVEYGDLEYSSSDASSISLTVSFDNALQTPAGVGSPITRTNGVIAV